jgi:predicted TPR repeat methyltransferase
MEIGLDDAYSLKTPQDNKNLYAKWAATYESDFVANQGYQHPKIISELFDAHLPTLETVVDIGTGTGLVGQYLSMLRPELIIDGIDISPEMLAEAAKKNVYRNLYERDLTVAVRDTAAPYDALITIGTFTHGHLGPETLLNLFPLVKKDGYFVIAVNENFFHQQNFLQFLTAQKVDISFIEKVQVYDQSSAHRDSMNVVIIFQ